MSNDIQLNKSDDMVVGVVGGGRPSTDIVVGVVGGGPAGLMAAGTAASQGARVLLIEKNESCGKKLLITGSGKCNITNTLPIQDFLDGFFENKKFLYPALTRFSSSSLLEFFGKYGLSFITVDDFKIFPETERADTVLNALLTFCKNQGVEIISNSRVAKIEYTEQMVEASSFEDTSSAQNSSLSNPFNPDMHRKFIINTQGKDFYCDRVIIATGGLSYPITGSTGDGYLIANALNHRIVSTRPALVGIKTDNILLSELSGVSLRDVKVSLVDSMQKSSIASQTGDVLFTHTGLSGPCILNISRYIPSSDIQKSYCLQIDLFQHKSLENLDKELIEILSSHQKKELKTAISKSFEIPASFASVLTRLCGLQQDILCSNVTKGQRKMLLQSLKTFTIPIKSTQGYEKAMVTAGGVATSEINPKTMESKLISGLYFAGEIIDIDGITGGYNLQAAFSTGFIAGESAGKI